MTSSSSVRATPQPAPVNAPAGRVAPAASAARFSELLRQARPPVLLPEPLPDPALDEPVDLALPGDEAWQAGRPAAEPTAHEPEDEWLSLPPPPEPTVAAAPIAPTTALTDEAARAAVREVALTVAGFCNDRAVGSDALWQVHMALRADVVPETTLHLALSPHWLTLRFHTGHAGVRQLLSQHEGALREALDATLVCKRDIAITFDTP